MPRDGGRKQKIDGGEKAESFIKASVRECSAGLELNCVHGVHYGLALWRWGHKFQEAEGVAGGEKYEENRGDAVEPGGFHVRIPRVKGALPC
jgi:hypothetical protein